jgi:hypothetical protein
MKQLLISILLLLSATRMTAQYTWCVSLNGKTKLKNVSENKQRNTIAVTKAELNKAGFFHIKFNRYDTAMRRTIMVDDSLGSGLQNWEEVKRSWQITTAELKQILHRGGNIIFYFTEIPRDVNQAMLVRVRPVHLCTIKRIKP